MPREPDQKKLLRSAMRFFALARYVPVTSSNVKDSTPSVDESVRETPIKRDIPLVHPRRTSYADIGKGWGVVKCEYSCDYCVESLSVRTYRQYFLTSLVQMLKVIQTNSSVAP